MTKRKPLTPEQKLKERARQRAWFKHKYDTDPEWRAKQLAKGKATWERNREKILAKQRGRPAKRTAEGYKNHVKRATEWTRRKRASDPEYRKLEAIKSMEWFKALRAKDPELAQTRNREQYNKRHPGRRIRRIIGEAQAGRLDYTSAIKQIREHIDRLNGACASIGGRQIQRERDDDSGDGEGTS